MNRTFRAHWSDEDGEFVGTCDQLPSLSWLAPTAAKALAGIMYLVAETHYELMVAE